MASVFKRSTKKGTPYTIQYVDEDGQRKTVKGFTDKALSEQLAAKLEAEARMRRSGLVDPTAERIAEHAKTPFDNHIEAFKKAIVHNSARYKHNIIAQVTRIKELAQLESLSQVTPEKIQNALNELLKSPKFGRKTYNHYLSSFNTFCNWCCDNNRLTRNPIGILKPLNVEVDVRRKRRALTGSELTSLVKSAKESKKRVQHYSGDLRSKLYLFAYFTGLRRSELGSLRTESFDLEREPYTLKVEASCSKHRREDTLPIHPELLVLLREWLPLLKPREHLFPKLGARKTWLMIKHDLEKAGIPYKTAEGYADFHASGRHTYITELLRNGASLPEAKELARHSDIKTTLRYTHIGLDDQAKAVKVLPSPKAKETNGSPKPPDSEGTLTAEEEGGSTPDGASAANALHLGCRQGRFVSLSGPKAKATKTQKPLKNKGNDTLCHSLSQIEKIGVIGFEPTTLWSQTRCASQTALHPALQEASFRSIPSDVRIFTRPLFCSLGHFSFFSILNPLFASLLSLSPVTLTITDHPATAPS